MLGEMNDGVESENWYRKAAEQGFDEGQYALGDMYYNGWGVQQDYTEAAKWLRKAAEQGNDSAQEDLTEMFASGLAVPQDPTEVERLCIAPDSVYQ